MSDMSDIQEIKEILDQRNEYFPKCLYHSFEEPLLVQSAKDQYYNNDILDLYNNVCHIGHSNKKIAEVISKEYNTVNINTRYLHKNLQEYALALFEHINCTKKKYKIIFVNSGSEANDFALRISLLYRMSIDNYNFISLKDSYHGTTYLCDKVSDLYSNGLSKEEEKNDKKGVFFIERNNVKQLNELFNTRQNSISSVILETIQGVAGNYPLSQEFVEKIFYYAQRDKILTICDEVQTGFGRTGHTFWSFEYYRVEPDIITCGKPIANGYPMGAVIIREDLADLWYSYFNTFGGNSVACAVAKIVLEELKNNNMISHSKEIGDYIMYKLSLVKGVDNITGRGLFIGFDVEIDPNYVIEKLKENKIIVGIGHNGRIRIKPPMVITKENINHFIDILSNILEQYV